VEVAIKVSINDPKRSEHRILLRTLQMQ